MKIVFLTLALILCASQAFAVCHRSQRDRRGDSFRPHVSQYDKWDKARDNYFRANYGPGGVYNYTNPSVIYNSHYNPPSTE